MMRRTAQPALAALFVAALMMTTGCASLNPFAPKPVQHREALSAAEWDTLKRDNAARIKGEGIPGGGPTIQPRVGVLEQMGNFFEAVFWTFPKRTYEYYVLGQTPGRYARMMEDDKSADNRRTGILTLAADFEFGRGEPYTKRYWQIAQGDSDSLVRAAAIRALNRSRDHNGQAIYLKGMDDANPLIRIESAKALANMPDPKAIPLLIKHLAPEYDIKGEGGRPERVGETRDIRLACADALRNFPEKDVAQKLVQVLKEKDFEIAWQARKSLVLMTGHDFRYDTEKWQEYLSKSANPFGGG